jgi:hypothetical protein
VNEKNYSWSVLEREVSSNLMRIYTSIKGKNRPDLLVFKPTNIPDQDFIHKIREVLLYREPKPDASIKIEEDARSLHKNPHEAQLPDQTIPEYI